MKILIFSDSHLTHKFNKEWFDYISNLIKDVDQVIINGDFWDGYLTEFDKFVNSQWRQLFPLLKEKRTIYIFGNHDKKKFMDYRYNLFSTKQVSSYKFKSGDKFFYVEHGHLIAPTYDNFLFFKNPSFVRPFYVIFHRIFSLFQHKKNIKKFNTIREFVKNKFVNRNNKKNIIYIFGHSHIPLMKMSENFISLGAFQNKQKSYCLIENGEINLMPKCYNSEYDN